MTTYIPSITIPTAVFEHPAASILLPIALGTAVGFGTRRMYRNPNVSVRIPKLIKMRLEANISQLIKPRIHKGHTWTLSSLLCALRRGYLVPCGHVYTGELRSPPH